MQLHSRISSVCKKWENNNIKSHSLYFYLYALTIMTLLLPFDYLLFNNEFFIKNRLIIINVILGILIIHFIKNKKENSHKIYFYTTSFLVHFISIYYLWFLLKSNEIEIEVVFLGNVLTVLFTTVALYKYWKLQLSYNLTQIVIISVCVVFNKNENLYNYTLLLTITHVCAGVMSFATRRFFFKSLYEKLLLLEMIIPYQIAEYVVTSETKMTVEDAFPLKQRFVCCLSSDWRGYQKIAKSKSIQELNMLQERYYETVFGNLYATCEDRNFFINWTADELFIVFFSLEENESKVLTDAKAFADLLSTEIYAQLQKLNINVEYDIGLSAGYGYLGVQGPSFLKKTTVTGEVAGRAKRLESHGKELRSRNCVDEGPNLVIDKSVYLSFDENIRSIKFEQQSTDIKDISSDHVYVLKKSFQRRIAS